MANIEMNVLKVGDSEFEIADAQARQDVSTLKEDLTHKANTDGYYADLVSGGSTQLLSDMVATDTTPYNYRTAGGSLEIGDREKLKKIVGVSLAVNQIVKNGNFADISNWSGSAATISASENVLTVTKSENTGDGVGYARQVDLSFTVGHKYIMSISYKGITGKQLVLFSNSANAGMTQIIPADSDWHTVTKIVNVTVTPSVPGILWLNYATTTADNVAQFKDYNIFDLTAMFGTTIADYVYGLETATAGAGVAWLKEHFPKIFNSGYVPYNAGTLVHVSGLSAKKTVGFNQFDGEYESGTYDQTTGEKIASTTLNRNVNPIKVLPSANYYWGRPIGAGRLFFYDFGMNFISSEYTDGRNFATPANCHYLNIALNTLLDISASCINLSDPIRNGTYEPYTVQGYPLDSTIDLHGILKLDSNNNLYADGDVYPPSGEVSHRYAITVLDGSSGTFSMPNTNQFNIDNVLESYKKSATAITYISSKYVALGQVSSNGEFITLVGTGDKMFNLTSNSTGNTIRVYDKAYSTIDEFKASLASNPLVVIYELATPTIETAEPYNPNQICDPNGTEEFISTTVAPVGHVTKYPENLRKKIEGLPWNFATLIAPTESTYKATRNYTTGSLFIVNNVLYKATANIANGATITPNSNCTSTTLAEVISALS